MADPTPYVLSPGTAREALTFYGDVFGCAVQLHTFEEFNRADGPADAIAHGGLTGARRAVRRHNLPPKGIRMNSRKKPPHAPKISMTASTPADHAISPRDVRSRAT